VIPTPPLRARNRLAETVLAALHDAGARRRLQALAEDAEAAEAWLGPDRARHGEVLRRRVRQAAAALAGLPVLPAPPSLAEALGAAAALFDAGLGFEVHELLEPFWAQATGPRRRALQGLIQIAVGYQHLANGNVGGAGALLEEGAARVAGQRLEGLDLDAFGRAVRAWLVRRHEEGPAPIPPFPRRG